MNTTTLNPTFSSAYYERAERPRAAAAASIAQTAATGKKRGEWTRIFHKMSHFMGDSRAAWASAGAFQPSQADSA